ncbi:MAG: sugar ABC transporter permease [bacterium]|nr:sugar ABC transporter permease [bacterium]
MHTQKTGWLFITPGLLLLALVMGYPLASLLINSTCIYDFADPRIARKFIGLQNYIDLFRDSRFLVTMRNTAVFTIFAVGIEFLIGLILALLLNCIVIGRRAIIGLLILPTASMPVAVGLVWRYMYNNEYGIISYFLKQVGLLGPGRIFDKALLTGKATAMGAIVATDIWEWTPFLALVLLGGLLSLSKEPFEAAKVDGASVWQTFWHITLPLLRPVIAIGVLIRISDAAKVLDIVYVLTGGGPGNATETAHLFAYRLNFKAFNMGYGAAQVVLLSVVVLAVSLILFKNIFEKGKSV